MVSNSTTVPNPRPIRPERREFLRDLRGDFRARSEDPQDLSKRARRRSATTSSSEARRLPYIILCLKFRLARQRELSGVHTTLRLTCVTRDPAYHSPSHKTFKIKKKLAKKMRQNRPIPHWIQRNPQSVKYKPSDEEVVWLGWLTRTRPSPNRQMKKKHNETGGNQRREMAQK
ncbi:hypothetical protein Sjap_019032 [Stephania japonica]|uniref:Uncharacterized protein n=1 Tax=Stephania japonica TaxID=461633 RepID=A0AAP0F3A9_9MAGN